MTEHQIFMNEALLQLVACVFAIVPYGPITDSVDQIEDNRFYDQEAKPVFRQAIFRNLDDNGYQTRDWRLVKEREPYIANGVMLWHDGTCLRRVRYGVLVTSWTQHDPELESRATLPQDQRKLLTVPKLKP